MGVGVNYCQIIVQCCTGSKCAVPLNCQSIKNTKTSLRV